MRLPWPNKWTLAGLSTMLLGVCGPSLHGCGPDDPERSDVRRPLAQLFGGLDRSALPPPAEPDKFGPAPYNVGLTILTIEADGFSGDRQKLGVAVWYPTTQHAKPYTYMLGENRLRSEVAPDAAPATGPFPLVLYSHGSMGTGLNAAFLAERLAGVGFVIAAPDYADEFAAARILAPQPPMSRLKAWRMLRWLKDLRDRQLNTAGKQYRHERLAYRPHEARAVIDLLLQENRKADSVLHGSIDEGEIAAVGHSFGAWTSLLIGGADPEFADPRVRAVVAYSAPCNANVFESGELASIDAPVLFMFGSDEPKIGRLSDRQYFYDRASPPKFLAEIRAADHFAFSGGIRREFDTVSEYRTVDGRRAAFVKCTENFLQYYLQSNAQAGTRLLESSPAIASFIYDLGDDSPPPNGP